jgi:glycine betaine catabolism B
MNVLADACLTEGKHRVPDRFDNPATWDRPDAHWASHEECELVCCRVTQETHDVRTFTFASRDGRLFSFEPGQFITLSVQIDGKAISRCYTISSAPTRPYTLSITVKRTPGGVMSNWLHGNLNPGMSIKAFGPAGVFTPCSAPCVKSLYLSAGSGITPLMSMTRSAADLGVVRDIVFVHSARTPDDIIFHDELARLEAMSDSLRVIHVCETTGSRTDWSGPVGRLNITLLEEHVPDFRDREVFTCGPAGYMNASRELLLNAGLDPKHYHQESFNFAETVGEALEESATSTAAQTAQTEFTIKFAKSGKMFTMDASQTILSAAKRAGVPLASSCSQGICGTCKVRVLDGDVDMKHNGGIRPREIEKGFRLMCCSKPTSDLVIDF